MAKEKRPQFKIGDSVRLSRIKSPIPAYDDKPFVGRDTPLRVSSITGKGTIRDPWGVRVTDGTHFWHLEPGDVTHAEESHMSKRSKPSGPKKSEAQLDGEIEEFLLNSPYAAKDGHTKVEFVYYIIPNGNKNAGGWLPVYDEDGKQRGDTYASRGMSKDDAWAESERIARERGGRFIGDWQIKLRKGKERK